MKFRLRSLLLSLSVVFSIAAMPLHGQRNEPVFMNKPSPWADSLLQTLTLKEKIGQFFMVAAWSDPNHKSYDAAGMDMLIKNYGIGGICFFQGSPYRQALLTNRFQSESKVPLLIGMDAEWGLGMRLDSTISFPRQMTLGAVQDENLIYQFGAEMARQLKRLGVHISFSPVVDVNNNPKNPVISNRSFGENRELVARYSLHYMEGLQDNGILANAKHFPGHGDTQSDSHKDLPVLNFDRARLDSLEFYPYKSLFENGLASVMVAHLYLPKIEKRPNLPSTLSPLIVDTILRHQMNFQGLIFTDALNMQGITKFFGPGDADLMALKAGNDVLLYSLNVPKAVNRIIAAVDSGEISMEEINMHCLRILRAKEWAGLHHSTQVNLANLIQDLNTPEALALQRRLIENSITVVKNEANMNLLCHSDSNRIAFVVIGASKSNPFIRNASKYARFDVIEMDKNPDFKKSIALHDSLIHYDLVVAAMLNTSNKASKNFGVSNEAARILNAVGLKTQVVLSVFANPYALSTLGETENIKSIVVSYQDDSLTQQITAEIIAGACNAHGKLPVSANNKYAFGSGVAFGGHTKLRWVSPAYLGICTSREKISRATAMMANPLHIAVQKSRDGQYREDMMSDRRTRIHHEEDNCFYAADSIALAGIKAGAYPGCRVLVAKNGFVIYDKAFGHLDWDHHKKVNLETVYDLASITKLASGTLAAMKLVDEKKMDVHKTLGDYLPFVMGTPYENVVIQEMLAHQAGFTPFIPFYRETMSNGALNSVYYKTAADSAHQLKVANDIYLQTSYPDSMWKRILNTPLSNDKSYKYSDLTFYFIQKIVERVSGQSLDQFVEKSFYGPMGLRSIGYNPLSKMSTSNIAPTENDALWRKQHIRGYVHDQGAAMLGGVGGHAGLFSNAQDLAAVMQMLLNRGEYGGVRYLSAEVIDEFNQRYYPGNRRGLGFDKPVLNGHGGSACDQASDSSFGHTGFTGTMCWADPETGLVFIFLSNRIDPDAENKKIQNLDIRTKIQSVFYNQCAN